MSSFLPSTSGPAALPQSVLQSLVEVKVDKYLSVAAATLFLYDYLLTLPAEIKLVWRRKWKATSVVFWLCRYTAFLDGIIVTLSQEFIPTPSIHACMIMYSLKTWFSVAGVALAEVILVLRTYAIWNGDKRIAALLFAILAGAVAGDITFAHRFLGSLIYSPTPSPTALPGCFADKTAQQLWGSYVCIVCFETIILSLTIYKALHNGRFQHSTIFQKVYQDGVLFYLYGLILSVIVIIVLVLPSLIALTGGLSSIYRILHTILSSRLLLNIRAAAFDTASRSQSMGNISARYTDAIELSARPLTGRKARTDSEDLVTADVDDV